jgi:hypothetical protein
VKKRNLFAVVAMFSIFLFGIGAAYAITGVNDAVLGTDIVIPLICEGFPNPGGSDIPIMGTMDTIYAIAEFNDYQGGYSCCTSNTSVCTPDPLDSSSTVGALQTYLFVHDRRSLVNLDTTKCWSKHDVISDSCSGLIRQMTNTEQQNMVTTINGIKYFVGYAHYSPKATCTGTEMLSGYSCGDVDPFTDGNRLMAWVYLNDATRGFAAGTNGVSIEDTTLAGFANAGLAEDEDVGVTAFTLFPRFFLLNADPDTFNWWILLLGRNQYSWPGGEVMERGLACYVCDEKEHCISRPPIPIPDEFNIIHVADVLPPGLFPGFPKAGFAYCDIVESGFLPGHTVGTTITGTLSFTDDYDDCTINGIDYTNSPICSDPETYSVFAWAYQRGVTAVPQKLAALHEMHRRYCSPYYNFGPTTAVPGATDDLPPRFWDDDNGQCCITGPIPGSSASDTNTWATCPF